MSELIGELSPLAVYCVGQGVTAGELAKASGYSYVHISKMWHGEQGMSEKMEVALAEWVPRGVIEAQGMWQEAKAVAETAAIRAKLRAGLEAYAASVLTGDPVAED